ncbi:hypothetical protein AKJ16_DCAP26157 [Drosera capensis]
MRGRDKSSPHRSRGFFDRKLDGLVLLTSEQLDMVVRAYMWTSYDIRLPMPFGNMQCWIMPGTLVCKEQSKVEMIFPQVMLQQSFYHGDSFPVWRNKGFLHVRGSYSFSNMPFEVRAGSAEVGFVVKCLTKSSAKIVQYKATK